MQFLDPTCRTNTASRGANLTCRFTSFPCRAPPTAHHGQSALSCPAYVPLMFWTSRTLKNRLRPSPRTCRSYIAFARCNPPSRQSQCQRYSMEYYRGLLSRGKGKRNSPTTFFGLGRHLLCVKMRKYRNTGVIKWASAALPKRAGGDEGRQGQTERLTMPVTSDVMANVTVSDGSRCGR